MPKDICRYKQRFRKEWISNEIFKDWISEIPDNSSRVHCTFCRCDLNAKYYDLINHSESKKHKKAIPYKIKPRTDYYKPNYYDNYNNNNNKKCTKPKHKKSLGIHMESMMNPKTELHSKMMIHNNIDEYEDLDYESNDADDNDGTGPSSNTNFLQQYGDLKVPKSALIKHVNEEVENGSIILHDNKIFQQVPNSSSIVGIQNSQISQSPSQSQSIVPVPHYDEFSTYANYVAVELRLIENKYIRQFAKQKINSIIYEASTGVYDHVANIGQHAPPTSYVINESESVGVTTST